MEGTFFQALELAVGALCPGCGQEQEEAQARGALCQQCCGKWPSGGSGIFSFDEVKLCRAGLYQGSLRQLVLRAKATADSPAFHPLCRTFINLVQEAQLQPTWLTVPPPSWRRRWQGWHLAEELAMKLAREQGWAYRSLLRRKRSRPAQAGLGAHARRKNLEGAFAMAHGPKGKLPKQVWIVDDVWTTGATFRECRQVLEEAGVQVLGVLLLAQVDQLMEAQPNWHKALLN